MSNYSNLCILTLRGKAEERDKIHADARAAKLSLNNYVRMKLGLTKGETGEQPTRNTGTT